MILGERVKKMRLDKGWGQSELSTYAHIALSVVTKIEQDTKGDQVDVRLSSLRGIAKALGVSVSKLLDGVE